MATLVKTGIGDGQTLTPVHITELYDAFTGDKTFDNLKINNRMKITHDGKVAIGTSVFATPYELNVQGTVAADTGRFTNLIVTNTTFQTSSIVILTGSKHFGSLDSDLHQFTGSLRVSGSLDFENYFLNGVVIGKTEATRNIFEVQGSGTFSQAITASDLTLSGHITGSAASSASFGHLYVVGDTVIDGDTTIRGNLTFGNADTDSVSFGAEIISDIVPDADSTYNIGSSAKNWQFGHIEQVSSTHITASGNISSSGLILTNNGLKINSTLSSPFISGSLASTGSFGRSTIGGDLHVHGTASIGHMAFNDFVAINTGSIGFLNVSSLSVNNVTGSDNTILRTDGNGLVSFKYADRTSVIGKNLGSTVLSGSTPVYIENQVSTDLYGINLARADNSGKRPAIGLLQDTLNPNETGSVILNGLVRGLDVNTLGFSEGDELFLGSIGGLTNTKPTGADTTQQKLGIVLGVGATNGQILVFSTGGSESPLILGQINFGSVTNSSEAIHISGALNTTTIQNITASGNITAITSISGSLFSTGSFGKLHVDSNVGIHVKQPRSTFHISASDGLIIPVGNTSQRNSSATIGEIRFNNQVQSYEGYDGDNWGTLGGMTDVDQDTKITAETSAGTDNDELQFFTAGVERLRILADGHISASGNITASSNLEVRGNISSSASSTGSFGLVEIAGIDINPSGVARDQVLKFNGTNFVAADPDDTFVFTIADFDMNDSTTPQLIGTGSWKAVGELGFTASYNNGPPDGFEGSSAGAPKIQGYVDGAVSSSYDMFPLSSSFTLGTNPMTITFPPNSSDDIRFRLFASAGSDTDNEYTDQRIFFFNQFVFGELSKDNGFNQADISSLAAANTVTSNDTTRTLSVSIGGSNYLAFAHRTGDTNVAQVYSGNNPNRLTVAMDRSDATTITPLKETVSYLNTAGKTENFFVYASKNQNIDAHSSTFVTTTSTQKRNYIYWGAESSWTNNESNVEDLDNKSTTYDDGSITGNTLSVGTFTSKFVIVAIPNRYGDNDTDYQFKDNSTNLPFAFDQQSDVTITNAVGFQEDYSVYKSSNQLTMTNATVLIDSV